MMLPDREPESLLESTTKLIIRSSASNHDFGVLPVELSDHLQTAIHTGTAHYNLRQKN